MNEMENARLLLDYSRLFFKDSFKTGNKIYSMSYGAAEPSRKLRRKNHSEISSDLIRDFRKTYNRFSVHDFLGSLPREARAGNCGEYVGVALKHGLENKIQNIWLVLHDKHEFLVLAADPGLNAMLTLSEFCQYENYNYWVCDPWFNIHCKMHLYGVMVNLKSTQWEYEGKEIQIDANYNEPATQWCQRLSIGTMVTFRMTDSSGQPTADCIDFSGY
ncbi:hypothetical protein NX722_19595 [Endozoicomonas gorgoniicola]|uniref:Uncharacterized protein n=1 Tax=Endozoicomonas gorgoniicola TaxID=1234144 RepID=A0ABT3MZI8_9GAMM|nr:hypothetical protein [Endozoicomonas gorgoniicola]MCW7554782.1 hypothetical protein [Endozoicomonas gorgoniicola]